MAKEDKAEESLHEALRHPSPVKPAEESFSCAELHFARLGQILSLWKNDDWDSWPGPYGVPRLQPRAPEDSPGRRVEDSLE